MGLTTLTLRCHGTIHTINHGARLAEERGGGRDPSSPVPWYHSYYKTWCHGTLLQRGGGNKGGRGGHNFKICKKKWVHLIEIVLSRGGGHGQEMPLPGSASGCDRINRTSNSFGAERE